LTQNIGKIKIKKAGYLTGLYGVKGGRFINEPPFEASWLYAGPELGYSLPCHFGLVICFHIYTSRKSVPSSETNNVSILTCMVKYEYGECTQRNIGYPSVLQRDGFSVNYF